MSFYGPKWNFTSSLLAGDIDPCSDQYATNNKVWQGLTCDHTPFQCSKNISLCSVVAIDLDKYGMQGPLSDTFDQLINMQNISMQLNKLTGPIPPSLFEIKKLVSLNFGFNRLSQSIPSSIGNVTNLIKLYLYNNMLTGPIPPAVGS